MLCAIFGPLLSVGRYTAAVLILSIVTPAFAGEFSPADITPGAAWGDSSIPNPIRPRDVSPIDQQFRRDLRDAAWANAYQAALLDAPLSLDSAVRFRFFAPPHTIGIGVGQALFTEDAERTRADKQRQALAPLLQELDGRFQTLTDTMKAADRVILPARKVYFCTWIKRVLTASPVPDIVLKLDAHCNEDRTAFLSALAARYAAQEQIAGLPLDDPAQATVIQSILERSRDLGFMPTDLVRPQRESPLAPAYPADDDAAGTIEAMDAAYLARLRARYNAAGDQMEQRLLEAIRHYNQTDVITDPARECALLLGPYARVATDDPRAGLTKRLAAACLVAVNATIGPRLKRIAAAVHQQIADQPMEHATVQQIQPTCFALWRPYFNLPAGVLFTSFAGTGLTPEQTFELGKPCQADIDGRNQAIYGAHLAEVTARVKTFPLTMTGLEQGHWFELLPADFDWVPSARNPLDHTEVDFRNGAMNAFRADYEKVAGPLRDTATAAGLREIDTAFGNGSVSAPRGVNLCEPYVLFSRRSRALPISLAPNGPFSAFSEACHARMKALTAARRAKADAEAGVDDVLKGLRLAVKDLDGTPVTVGARRLVAAAADDGVQVKFIPAHPSIEIRSFNPEGPTLTGNLSQTTRADDAPIMLISDLGNLPLLDGPEQTIDCLLAGHHDAVWDSVAKTIGGFAVAALSDTSSPLAGRAMHEGVKDRLTAERCVEAKHAFTGELPPDP